MGVRKTHATHPSEGTKCARRETLPRESFVWLSLAPPEIRVRLTSASNRVTSYSQLEIHHWVFVCRSVWNYSSQLTRHPFLLMGGPENKWLVCLDPTRSGMSTIPLPPPLLRQRRMRITAPSFDPKLSLSQTPNAQSMTQRQPTL